MKRRDFITLLGGAAAAWPLVARAQQSAMPVIGWLDGGAPDQLPATQLAFRQGLSETGYVEGRNVAIEYRLAESHYDRLPGLAADLVRRQASVIVASSGVAAQAAKAATTTLPVVFFTGGDPVADGFVTRLDRPGGNLTGVTILAAELAPKKLELLHELVPAAAVLGALVNPGSRAAEYQARELQAAGRVLGLQVRLLQAGTEREIDTAFADLVALDAGGLVITSDNFFVSRIDLLAALALRHAMPTVFQRRDFATAGGLLSYGGRAADGYRQIGIYAGRILKGEKPADLPIQQSTKVELFINLKTAKSLGRTVPLSLLGRADEVIE
jgi:putative ABC transport system substrate-binding protein